MINSSSNKPSEGFDSNRVSYLLDSAALAEQDGNSRLAIHLYCAAFEASQECESGVDERALSGLRQAWLLACEQGDRSTAETIFNDLAPYNSDEQTRDALAELQDMAFGQLGINKEEMEGMALAFADEIRDAGIDVKALAERFGALQKGSEDHAQHPNLPALFTGFLEDSPAASSGDKEEQQELNAAATTGGGEYNPDEIFSDLSYIDLVGFEKAKEKMRVFGIVDPQDVEMNDFLQQAETFHGFSGPVLTDNFLFVGSSREDCGIFAQATAHEIGMPVITMIVDVNELGDGTIKVAAPVKRSIFGPPRLTDLPNPCTLIIQNIDILQDLFWSEEQAFSKGQGPFGQRRNDECPGQSSSNRQSGAPQYGGYMQHSLQHEILNYLGALMARGGVFVIATSALSSNEHPLVLSEQLEGLLRKPVEITIDMPTLQERQRVLTAFSKDHPSFHDLDRASLACLSEGMSRFEIIASSRQAVELAYSESLKSRRHKMVSLETILTQFTQYLPQDSDAYRLAEDYLVALFAADLESNLMQQESLPGQISFEWERDDDGGEQTKQ